MSSLGTVESEHLVHTAFEVSSVLREHPPQLATPVACSSQHARHLDGWLPVPVIVITLNPSVVLQVVQSLPAVAVEQIDSPME